MKAANVGVVYRKELKDMLRDRKTLISMFLFPLILFPLMTVGFGTFERRMRSSAQAAASKVMILGADHAPELAARLRETEGLEILPVADDYKQRIADKKLRAAIEFPAGFEATLGKPGTGEPPTVQIYFYSTETRSQAAVTKLEDVVNKYRQEAIERRLQTQGMSKAEIQPVEVKQENVAAPEKVAGSRLAIMLPYFIVFLCFMGAIGPAIDLTAGEKERGTLETILASAVGRDDLVMGKFLLVLTTSLTTAVMSLLSFAVTTRFSKEYMEQMTGGHAFSISATTIAAALLVVLPMSVLFSATLIALCLQAKSFKEAQNYTGPMLLLIIMPAMAGMIPGVELNLALAAVPVLNVSLVTKELFGGNLPMMPIAVTFISTSIYAGIALFAAFKMFQTESVLFRS